MTRQDPGVPAADDAEEAHREMREAMDAYGATSMILCAQGKVSPAALRAIAASIRSLGDD